jgi:putative molybdopterin biosynthesis protein
MNISIEYKLNDNPCRNNFEHPLVDLLQSVNDTGSIKAAANLLGRSYRYVWGELKNWESDLNTDLIIWGPTGKGAELTPKAIQFLIANSKVQAAHERNIFNMKRDIAKCLEILSK